MKKEGYLYVFYGTNLIFVESFTSSQEKLFEFIDMKQTEGFKIKTLSGGIGTGEIWLGVLEKKG